jgi:hypothetical protein
MDNNNKVIKKQIRDSIQFIPEGQRNLELFIKVTEMIDYNRDNFEIVINDILSKYASPSTATVDVVKEVFYENGLTSVVDLFDTFETIDFNTILAFSGYILYLKGSINGYKLVLTLLGFDYTLEEWWEQTPKGRPNTISIDVNLNSSEVASPYLTFQKIKTFTREYIFPIIDPLGYTLTVTMADLAILCIGFSHGTYFGQDITDLDENLLFSNTKFILLDENEEKWNIKINAFGAIQAFKEEDSNPLISSNYPTQLFAITRPDSSLAQIKVDSNGSIFAIDAEVGTIDDNFYLTDRLEVNRFFRVTNDNIVYTEL